MYPKIHNTALLERMRYHVFESNLACLQFPVSLPRIRLEEDLSRTS